MTAAFISSSAGAADRDITVPTGADLMVVALISATETTRTAASFDGNALSAATTANAFTAVFYLLAPEVDAVAALLITPNTNLGADGMVVAFYSTTTSGFSFQSGQQASTGSASYSPSGAAVICHGISATSAGTPVASTNERYDSGSGTWYGDRIVTGSGSVTVGATISDPDYGGAIFLEASTAVSVSGSVSALLPTASGTALNLLASGSAAAIRPTATGSATVVVNAAGSVAAPKPAASGSAAVVVDASGSVAAPRATASGSATVVVNASGSVAAPLPSAAGEGTLTGAVSGTPTAPLAGASGSATVLVDVSGTPAAPAPTVSGSVTIDGVDVDASGSVSAPLPTASGSATVTVSVSGSVAAPSPTASGSASGPDLGTGRGSASVTVPTGTASVTSPGGSAGVAIASGTATVTVPRGTASVQVQ